MIKRYLFSGIMSIIITTTMVGCSSQPESQPALTEQQYSSAKVISLNSSNISNTTEENESTFDISTMYSEKLGRTISTEEYDILVKFVYQQTYFNQITDREIQTAIASVPLNEILEGNGSYNLVDLIKNPMLYSFKDDLNVSSKEYWDTTVSAVNDALNGKDPTACIGGANFYTYQFDKQLNTKSQGCVIFNSDFYFWKCGGNLT